MSDESSADEDDPDLQQKTPMTKRRIKDEKIKKEVKKLGTFGTYLTLIKGFICTSVLYLPQSFVSAGYGISILTLIMSCAITMVCAKLILEVRAKL